jgi:putative methyltransferase (TIGR04325 family)
MDLSFQLRNVWNCPGLKQLRRSGRLNSLLHVGYGAYWGRFDSRDGALAFLRPSQRLSYDNDDVVEVNLDVFLEIHLFDWPVMFFLQTQLRQEKIRTLTDFGGHVGVKYYAYRSLMGLPDNFQWQVVDVPAVCREGRLRLLKDDETLSFFEKIEDTRPCDALLCSGALQYADLTLQEIVARLPSRPTMIILNKIAVAGGEGFYTLESFGWGRMPYRIVAQAELDQAREELGYNLVFRWDIPYRHFEVPSAQGMDQVDMIGEVWSNDSNLH